MAKQGTKIDELFISLGMDLSSLDADLISADKTISQGLQSLYQKATQAKLKMDIDASSLDGAGRSVDALANKEQHLTALLNIQKQTITLLHAAYQQSVRDKGAEDAATQRLLTRLLREQKAQADLEGQIRRTNQERQASAAPVAGKSEINSVNDITGTVSNKFAMIKNAALSIVGIIAGGFGLKEIVKSAADAGDSVYKMSQKMHLSAAEAAGLSRMLKLADVDSTAFISTMIRLDKSIGTAGKNGNVITNALKEFGVSLTDANGSLLPMNEQLERLAIGYNNAAAKGMEEEYVAKILGARGQALVPILEEYTEVAERAGKIKTIGIDPEKAHEAEQNMKVLATQVKQLEMAFGNAFLPLANVIFPRVTERFGEMTQGLKRFLDLWDSGHGLQAITDAALGERTKGWVRNAGWGDILGDDTLEQLREEKKIKDDADRAAQKAISDQAASEAKQEAAAKASAKAHENLQNQMYKATHTRIENELYDIDLKTKKAIEDGADEEIVVQDAEFAKAEIIKKYNEEIKDSQTALYDAILKVTGHRLEARLGEIERERNAWIKKTQDEVTATEWAENEKLKAVKDAIRARYGEEIRAVEAALKAGTDPYAAYNKAHEAVMKNLEIEDKAFGFVREKLGVQLPGDTINTINISGNTATQMSEVVKSLQYNAELLERTPKESYVSFGNINISVPVTAVAPESDVNKIASAVADIIEPAVVSAISQDNNQYGYRR